MPIIALTQEPEVKVRLAMIGKWCLPSCPMLAQRYALGDYDVVCQLYTEADDEALQFAYPEWRRNAPNLYGHWLPQGPGPGGEGYLRNPACIAAHGGGE